MNHLHTVIVPGVGGSDEQHWQTWLENSVACSSRVMQADWNKPILNEWVNQLFQHIQTIKKPIQIVAHSFGCLTTIAAINQYPVLKHWIDSIILVAPANPTRFNSTGFGTNTDNFVELFQQFHISIPTLMIISENDPWLEFDDAIAYAKLWNVPYVNQGCAGHINVASGFGAWPEILDHMQSVHTQHELLEQQYFLNHRHFRFAV